MYSRTPALPSKERKTKAARATGERLHLVSAKFAHPFSLSSVDVDRGARREREEKTKNTKSKRGGRCHPRWHPGMFSGSQQPLAEFSLSLSVRFPARGARAAGPLERTVECGRAPRCRSGRPRGPAARTCQQRVPRLVKGQHSTRCLIIHSGPGRRERGERDAALSFGVPSRS